MSCPWCGAPQHRRNLGKVNELPETRRDSTRAFLRAPVSKNLISGILFRSESRVGSFIRLGCWFSTVPRADDNRHQHATNVDERKISPTARDQRPTTRSFPFLTIPLVLIRRWIINATDVTHSVSRKEIPFRRRLQACISSILCFS